MASSTLIPWPNAEKIAAVSEAFGNAQELLELLTHDYQALFSDDGHLETPPGAETPTADDVIELAVFVDQRKIDLELAQGDISKLEALSVDALYLYGNAQPRRERPSSGGDA